MSILMDIKKSFGEFSLDIQLEAKNEVMALLGASGCGKSMTLKCIAGIVRPDEGYIVVDGVVLFDSHKKINLPPQKRKTGLLFQSYALFPNMTVFQNIRFAISENNSGVNDYIAGLLKAFHLKGLENRYPHQLSGGQQQRVALARILASKPNILLLDEPFSALDSYLRWQLEQEISAHLAEFGGTTLFVSHNRDEVYRICSKISIVSNGKIDVQGDKWSLFHNPQTYAGALLTGCKNISAVVRTSPNTVRSEAWGIALFTDETIADAVRYVGIRARELELAAGPGEPNAFPFEIVREIQDTFTCILMIRPLLTNGSELIRWEMSKPLYRKIMVSPRFAKIKSDKVLLLA